MRKIRKEDSKRIFIESLEKVNAIEFPRYNDAIKKMCLLFLNEEYLNGIVQYFQNYDSKGYSVIIEKIDEETINFKIYEPYTDDFYIIEKITIRTGILKYYEELVKEETFLSVGTISINDGKVETNPFYSLAIPLKSVSIVYV